MQETHPDPSKICRNPHWGTHHLLFHNEVKHVFHYFIYYTCEILKVHNKKFKPVIYFDFNVELNKVYSKFLHTFEQKFPVLILSIATKDKKIPIKVKLIEKSIKKADFLKKTIKKLNLNAEVICENILEDGKNISGEFFIARAFKPLPVILKLMHNQATNFKKFIIFLGKNGKKELLHASKTWDIQYKQSVSITSSDSLIIEINKLKKINWKILKSFL